MIVTLLFERAWGNQLEGIPCTFVYSLCTNASQGIIWIFYYCVVKLQAIEFLKELVLLFENVSNLRLEEVHLINQVYKYVIIRITYLVSNIYRGKLS